MPGCQDAGGTGSGDAQQLDFEDERGAAGDAGLAETSIALLGGDVDLPFVADMHLLEGYDPSRDEVAQAECRGNSSSAAVKCLAVDCLPYIVGRHYAVAVGHRPLCVAVFHHFARHTFVEELDTRLFRLVGKPLPVLFYVFLFCHRRCQR